MPYQFGLLFLFAFLPTLMIAQTLSTTTAIDITKTWSQAPNGWTYPISIKIPTATMPTGGYPVAIILHGNGGNGNGSIAQWGNSLPNHILVAPSGYRTSWNIADEASDAPDVAMITELVDQLQTYSNVNPTKIRLIGSSNGSALCNRVFIENEDPGIDIICAIVSQLNVPQYHNNSFYYPSAETGDPAPFDGYDTPKVPITGRRYLSICNENDGIIPYAGGPSVVGVDFLAAQEAAFIIAQSQGYTGEKLPEEGTPLDGANTYEYAYLAHQVVHLRGDAGHSVNTVQKEYVSKYFNTADTDKDEDGFAQEIDCDDDDATIGAKQPEGTACDDGDAATQNDQIQADGCSCLGTILLPTECLAPTTPTTSSINNHSIVIDWPSVVGAVHYVVQLRYKGTDDWLVTQKVPSPKIYAYGPLSHYEYRIKTICKDGESEYGAIYEFSFQP